MAEAEDAHLVDLPHRLHLGRNHGREPGGSHRGLHPDLADALVGVGHPQSDLHGGPVPGRRPLDAQHRLTVQEAPSARGDPGERQPPHESIVEHRIDVTHPGERAALHGERAVLRGRHDLYQQPAIAVDAPHALQVRHHDVRTARVVLVEVQFTLHLERGRCSHGAVDALQEPRVGIGEGRRRRQEAQEQGGNRERLESQG